MVCLQKPLRRGNVTPSDSALAAAMEMRKPDRLLEVIFHAPCGVVENLHPNSPITCRFFGVRHVEAEPLTRLLARRIKRMDSFPISTLVKQKPKTNPFFYREVA